MRGHALAVALPGSTQEVAEVVKACQRHQVAIVPQGGNTGLAVGSVPDVSGRQSPEPIEGAEHVEDADLVIKALGFEPEDLPVLFGQPDLPVTRWGTIKAAFGSGATEMPGIYAVGDIVRGASLVVWAIRDGRDCADAILKDFDSVAAVAAE